MAMLTVAPRPIDTQPTEVIAEIWRTLRTAPAARPPLNLRTVPAGEAAGVGSVSRAVYPARLSVTGVVGVGLSLRVGETPW